MTRGPELNAEFAHFFILLLQHVLANAALSEADKARCDKFGSMCEQVLKRDGKLFGGDAPKLKVPPDPGLRNDGVEIITNEVGEDIPSTYAAFTDTGNLLAGHGNESERVASFDVRRLAGRRFPCGAAKDESAFNGKNDGVEILVNENAPPDGRMAPCYVASADTNNLLCEPPGGGRNAVRHTYTAHPSVACLLDDGGRGGSAQSSPHVILRPRASAPGAEPVEPRTAEEAKRRAPLVRDLGSGEGGAAIYDLDHGHEVISASESLVPGEDRREAGGASCHEVTCHGGSCVYAGHMHHRSAKADSMTGCRFDGTIPFYAGLQDAPAICAA